MTEDNCTIRKASPADLPRIHGIYAAARQFMRDHGNFSQWDGEDAPEHLLPGDIEAGNLYVLEENGVIHAAFAFIIGADPCYAVIEQGAWKADTPYAAVHRVASDGTVHNILGRIMDFAKSKISHTVSYTHLDVYKRQTQILNACTLAPLSEAQRLDGLDENETTKRYMHHYNFPSFSVGETKPSRGPGRREIGHGALAERALVPVLPSEEEFPYAIRTVSCLLYTSGPWPAGPGGESRQGKKWRVLHREGGKVRKSRTGDRIGRIFGQHKENVPEHVYLL